MIFVTVGNATQGFSRLLEAVDALAGTPLFQGEPVFMQTGHNENFQPRHSRTEAFLSADRFLECLKEARLIICHGGCGTLLQAISLGKVPIVVPRLARYGEHVNNHQLQLIRALADEGRVIPAYEIFDLREAIRKASHNPPPPSPSTEPSPMIRLVEQAMVDLMGLGEGT
ncbi:MAG: glycosyltransferase [Elusimicrobiota bacterium]|jgi:UDP-N-acetylglucosamine transferase subunit ALG13